MNNSAVDIRRAKKTSLLYRTISGLVSKIILDDKRLSGIFVNRVELSPKKSSCHVFFYTSEGEEHFREMLGILILYKPSLRSAVAHTIDSKYVPELIFVFDKSAEKANRINALIDAIKEKEEKESADNNDDLAEIEESEKHE